MHIDLVCELHVHEVTEPATILESLTTQNTVVTIITKYTHLVGTGKGRQSKKCLQIVASTLTIGSSLQTCSSGGQAQSILSGLLGSV